MNNQKNKKNRKINWKSPVHHKNSIEKKVKKKFQKIFKFLINQSISKLKNKIWNKMNRLGRNSKHIVLVTMRKRKLTTKRTFMKSTILIWMEIYRIQDIDPPHLQIGMSGPMMKSLSYQHYKKQKLPFLKRQTPTQLKKKKKKVWRTKHLQIKLKENMKRED